MNFSMKDEGSAEIAARMVSCINLAFDDMHSRTFDRWEALRPARPHIMHALIVDELRQEFAGDSQVQPRSSDQLNIFTLPERLLQMRVKKKTRKGLAVSSNETIRDGQWGLSVSQVPLPLEGVDQFERLILAYETSADWNSLLSVSFMEFHKRKCVSLEYLPLVADISESVDPDSERPDRMHPPIFRINMDGWERQDQPEIDLEYEEEDELGS